MIRSRLSSAVNMPSRTLLQVQDQVADTVGKINDLSLATHIEFNFIVAGGCMINRFF